MSLRFLFIASLVLVADFAAAAGGESGLRDFGWSWFNFILIAGLLFFLGRKHLPELMATRRATVKGEIDKAANLLAEADSRLAEWQGKVDALGREVEGLRGESLRLAEAEKESIIAQAHKTAERIREEGKAAVAREVESARTALRTEAANLAIEYAQEILAQSTTDDDRAQLLDGFIESLQRSSDEARS